MAHQRASPKLRSVSLLSCSMTYGVIACSRDVASLFVSGGDDTDAADLKHRLEAIEQKLDRVLAERNMRD